MITISDLKRLGYRIEIHLETNTASITGFGIATMFDLDDQEHIDSFFITHEDRATQIRE